MKRSCSVDCQRVARLVGNVDNDPEQFAVQTKEEFNKLLKIQDDEDLDSIDVQKLRARGRALGSSENRLQGMDSAHLMHLCTFFQKFDANGDGKVDLEEFRTMVRTSSQAANLFTGSEDLEHLSVQQMDALLQYKDWPARHQGPGDIGMLACLCCVLGRVRTLVLSAIVDLNLIQCRRKPGAWWTNFSGAS
jgi:hypothetical protein